MALHDTVLARQRMPAQFAKQTALAHAGLGGDQDAPTLTVFGMQQRGVKAFQFASATDQYRRRDRLGHSLSFVHGHGIL